MKKIYTLIAAVFLLAAYSQAQLRVGLIGGGHQSKVVEENDLPNWDDIKNNYTGRTGLHFGVIADIRLGKSNFYFQPGIIYQNKGRKFAATYDTTLSDVLRISSNEFINYLDMPFNFVYKARLGGNVKFILGGGPYLSFFYTGKLKTETVSKSLDYEAIENNDPPVGNKEGQYAVMDYGVNGLAGFELGRVMLTANYSQGLKDFFKSDLYKGTFRHQVLGVTLGVFIDGNKKPKIGDKDNDGVKDNVDKCPEVAGFAKMEGCPDSDSDGIVDGEDACPGLSGSAKNNGCPDDKDKDGVPDREDKCPTVAGTKEDKGCPPADSDKDGIIDADDKCPTIPGTARYSGCAIPDTDGDGINDEEDKCPAVKGTRALNGCPEPVKKEIIEKVNYAAKRVQFDKGNANLLSSSNKVLDEVVKILKQDPSLQLTIEGHTSNDGIREANMKLSRARAIAVKNYLISKGISANRLTAKGLGPDQMLNAGKTEAEKAKNRRVEMKVSNQ
jgi:outer membrane protein OmpA-like peptidoglycan-associated protein